MKFNTFTTGEKMVAIAALGYGIWGASNVVQNNFDREDVIPKVAGGFSSDMVQDVAGILGKEFRLVDKPEGGNIELDLETEAPTGGTNLISNPAGDLAVNLTVDMAGLPEVK